MILIADSGSTKTDWLLVESNYTRRSFRTIGLNPYYIDDIDIRKTISLNLLRNFDAANVSAVYFYGSGCGADIKKNIIFNVLSDIFVNATINVFTDILGASRALFGSNKGIACILGTGSNSCLYDGSNIVSILPSLGFIFGDEGGGSNLGKLFLDNYFNNKLPVGLKSDFINRFNLTDQEILDSIYRKPFPNKFLASFSQFICEKSNNRFIKILIEDSFSGFVNNHIFKYKNYRNFPIGFIGSVAFFYRKNLENVFRKNNLNIVRLMKSPVDGLADYHLNPPQINDSLL